MKAFVDKVTISYLPLQKSDSFISAVLSAAVFYCDPSFCILIQWLREIFKCVRRQYGCTDRRLRHCSNNTTMSITVPLLAFAVDNEHNVPRQQSSSFHDNRNRRSDDDDDWSYNSERTCKIANLNEENKKKVCFFVPCVFRLSVLRRHISRHLFFQGDDRKFFAVVGMKMICGREREEREGSVCVCARKCLEAACV
jgi:hypothetical protein